MNCQILLFVKYEVVICFSNEPVLTECEVPEQEAPTASLNSTVISLDSW